MCFGNARPAAGLEIRRRDDDVGKAIARSHRPRRLDVSAGEVHVAEGEEAEQGARRSLPL